MTAKVFRADPRSPGGAARAAIVVLTLLATVGVASGCPKRQGFDPAVGPPLPSAGDAEARARFQEARARFERDEWAPAGEEFTRIARDYPDDPIAAHAKLYAGVAAYRQAAFADAVAALGPLASAGAVEAALAERARFFLGLSLVRLGRHAEARPLLEPFVGRLAGGEEEADLHAALAEATTALGDGEAALGHWDRVFARGRPPERAYAAARVRALVDSLAPDVAARAYAAADKRLVAAAFLGRRLAAEATAGGDRERARRVRAETAQAREAAGLLDEGPASARADAGLVGALLPLGGRRRLVGETALRGLAVAAAAFDRAPPGGVRVDGMPAPFRLTVRDAGEAGKAAAALEDLAAEGAVAVVALLERADAEQVGARAEALGMAIVVLDAGEASEAPGGGRTFRIVLPVEVRARALARHAHAQGARTFGVLAPEIAYGGRAAAAFRAEVERLGGRVVVEVTYPKTATAFVEPVRRVAAKKLDALFIPDTAARLELIAPQLAVADLVVQPPGAAAPARGRPVLLLATAEALTSQFLRGSARYTTGAVLAPGFYADEADPRIGPFVRRFRAAYGEEPTYLDAYAFDAALLLRAAVEAGAAGRDAVAAALPTMSAAGVTGDLAFGPSGVRKGEGVLYSVTTEGKIRAMR